MNRAPTRYLLPATWSTLSRIVGAATTSNSAKSEVKRERKDGVDPSFTEWNNKSERHPATLEYTPSLFNNAAGAWNVKVSGDAGTADQRIDLTQDGNKIARTFKGPRQSGTIEGTVEGNNIRFRVKAFVPIDYVGTVDGDSMKGTLTGRGKTGEWTATRVK